MAHTALSSTLLTGAAGQQQIETDVLVIGGGPAGAWAAIAAAARGRPHQAAALIIADRFDPDVARLRQFANGDLHRLTPYHGTDAIWGA